MIIHRAYKTELDPNNKQRTHFLQHAGTARFVYNWGLSKRIEEYKETGKSSNAISQHRELNILKHTDFPWMYCSSKCAAQEALRDLDKAYKNFFNKINGFPKFKSRKKGIGGFRLTGAIHIGYTYIQLPRLGKIKLKQHGYIPIEGVKILSATVSEKAGKWFVSVACEQEIEVTQATGVSIGVDLGIKSLAVCSDGRTFENPKALKKHQKKLKRLQRELCRREKDSNNRKKTKTKLAKLHYKISCIRKDSLHKATTAICAKTKPDNERPSVIVIEDLNVAGMVKNHNLAQAISDVGMGEFRRQIEYKTKWYGEKLLVADRFLPSSKTCSVCGLINEYLTLKDRNWVCECGAEHDRDFNAAINLKNTVSSTEIYAYGEDVRLVVVSPAASMK